MMHLGETQEFDSTCPACGERHEAATGTADDQPAPGDVSVCIDCRAVSVVSDTGTLRRPTADEKSEFMRDPRIHALVLALDEVEERGD